jgi:hypothetical protein
MLLIRLFVIIVIVIPLLLSLFHYLHYNKIVYLM